MASRAVLPIAFLAASAAAQLTLNATDASEASTTTCAWDVHCPLEAPCCDAYGQCGTGSSCLIGCNPLWSFSIESCAPEPICKSMNYTFENSISLDRIAQGGGRIAQGGGQYAGDADLYDWTLDAYPEGKHLTNGDGHFVMYLDSENRGTLLSSTRSMLYGNVTARVRSTGMPGAVTAFILMSGVRDEVDWEWTASDLDTVMTNYYWLGDLDNWTHNGTSAAPQRDLTFHDYGLVWTPDSLSWFIDGHEVRTVAKETTKTDAGLYHFPQTPSRIQMSIWGVNGMSQGTVEWAGGELDWSQVVDGYITAEVAWVAVSCFDTSSVVPYEDTLVANASVITNEVAQVPSSTSSSVATTTAWWTPPESSVNPLPTTSINSVSSLAVDPVILVKRQQSGAVSYVYVQNDSLGQPGAALSYRDTGLTDLEMVSSVSVDQETADQGQLANPTAANDEMSDPQLPESSNISSSWDSLGQEEKAGVYAGIACAGVLLIAALMKVWLVMKGRRAAESKGKYIVVPGESTECAMMSRPLPRDLNGQLYDPTGYVPSAQLHTVSPHYAASTSRRSVRA